MKIFSRLLFSFLLIVLAGSAAWTGPLAPEFRVITSRDRDFIERSGAATLEELLDTGIVRYFYAGGQTLLILVDGRPYATSTSDLDTLPLSAIERIEVLSGETLGQYGGVAINGAINVIMRKDFDGVETRTLARVPSEDGGEGWQGSVFWGGKINDSGGHMSIGVDVLRREPIPSRSREFSRSVWKEGGTFSEAKNVSIGGNTLYLFDVQAGRYRTASLGDCETEKGYTGPLERALAFAPPGDKGCGFAYGNIAWNTSAFEQRTAIINLDQPLESGQNFHLFANLGQGKSSFRYAPSIGIFMINDPNDPNLTIPLSLQNDIVDTNDYVAIAHRFLGHGNRDWHTNYNEYDISLGIDGQLTNNIDYKTSISTYNLDGSRIGNTFVHLEKIQKEITDGNYDLINPTSPNNRAAIERTSLQEEIDFGQEYFEARVALEGQTFAIADRPVSWTAGLDASIIEAHSILRFVDNQNEEYDVTEVLGSGGVSYQGERKTIGAFGDMVLPVTKDTDFRVAARGDNYDDLGQLSTYHLSTEHRPNNVLTLRGSWGNGETAPTMRSLHSTAAQDHPYVRCVPNIDPDDQDEQLPRTCTNQFGRQVTREYVGNPKLDPAKVERVAIGTGFNWQSFYLDVEWYRLKRMGLPGLRNASWAILNLKQCEESEKTKCIESAAGGDITIYDSFENIIDTKISGITTRYRKSYKTHWGKIVLSGAWRRVNNANRIVEGNTGRYATSKNIVRSRFEAIRGDVTATWTVNYREGFRNQSDTGNFDDWLGHDFYVDWKNPWGIDKGRITAGVFNLTNASLSVDTADPNSVDGPEAAGWGRTFFLTFNRSF